MAKGKGSLSHNNREYAAHNVDASRTPYNIIYMSQSIEQAYDKLFSVAVDEFNIRARSDRRIKDSYFEHLFGKSPDSQAAKVVIEGKNKQKSFYEELVQIGDKDDTGVGSVDGQTATKILDEYMRGWQERNPSFYVFNAVLHLDERTPHLHIDYIPVAESKRGLSIQNGMAKALEQMGYDSRSAQGFKDWRQNERDVLTELCRGHGIEIAKPEESRGISLLPDEYKARKDAERQVLQDEIDKAVLEVASEKLALQVEITKLQAEADRCKVEVEQYRTVLIDAESRLQEALEPIEEQIDAALARKANNNVFKDVEVKKQSFTGTITLSRKTKGETLTVEQVESALELAKNQRGHEIRCNNKVKKAEAEVEKIKIEIKEIRARAKEEVEAVKVKTKEEISLAKKELKEQRVIAKQATDAWGDTIKILDGSTLNGVKIYNPENIADTVKYLKDGFFKHKKAAEQVPELERRIAKSEQDKKHLLDEMDATKSTVRKEFETKIGNLEQGVRDGYTIAAGLLASIRTYDLSQPIADFIEMAGKFVAKWIRENEIPYTGKELQEKLEAQAVRAESETRLAPAYFKALYPAAAEKERLRSLHKTSKWSDLTPDERQEVRRLLVNSQEFPDRQDYLDFKRAFGGAVERGR